MTVRRASEADLDSVAPLFDAYRQFYGFAADPARCRQFLAARLQGNESVVFVGIAEDSAIGFAQLYPSFSSGALAQILILNDLFVTPGARCLGVGTALLDAAAEHGRAIQAARIVLSTQLTNATARRLYESRGWKLDTQFAVYQLALTV